MRTLKIDHLLRDCASSRGVISFAGGLPSECTFPRESLAVAATEAMLHMGETPLQYDWPEGRPSLRKLIARRISARGVAVDPEDVIITNGVQEGLALILELLRPNEIQVDSATYAGALELFLGHRIAAVSGTQCAVRYAMPAVHNPSGWTLTAEQRARELESDVVIEDDAYVDLRFDGTTSPPLLKYAREKVFNVGSFSKTLSPGLRVGYMVPPPQHLEAIRRLKGEHDVQTSGVCQAIVERLLSMRDYDERLAKLRAHYQRRAEKMLSVLPHLRGVHFTVPTGGFSVWMQTDLPVRDDVLLQAGIEHGVSFDPGCLFKPRNDVSRGAALRLSFSSVPEEQIAPGIERLGAMLTSLQARARRAA